MKYILLLLFSVLTTQLAFSQNQAVQTFTYESQTRDTIIQFPDGDHNRFEKIIMYYSMRCKDGLVSTGSERNKGCGEWDYSCNTYIVDSTRIDSVKVTTPEYAMPGYSGSEFSYTDQTTYSFYQSIHKEIIYDDVLKEDDYILSEATQELDTNHWSNNQGLNMYYLIDANWFEQNDVDRLTGIRWPVTNEINFTNLIVQLSETNALSVDEALAESELEWQKYHHFNTTLTTENDLIGFYENYRWEEGFNVLVSFSYDNVQGLDSPIMGQTFDTSKLRLSTNQNSKYLSIGPSGNIVLPYSVPEISDEITVSFWQRGADNLPVNSTILEAVDQSNLRQVNIHLPWSNGQVYWDCGNNGGGYDRINKTADPQDYKGTWNHWAFTKNTNTGVMQIFLNGELWHSGTNFFKQIDISKLTIGSNITESLSYYGDLDELRIWKKALDSETIKDFMHKQIDAQHPDFNDLIVYYNFNSTLTDEIQDISLGQRNGEINGQISWVNWKSKDLRIDAVESDLVPAHNLVDGIYFTTILDSLVIDSIANMPQRIDHYVINGTDRELAWTDYFYAAGDSPIYDEDGQVVGSINYPEVGVFEVGELLYYNKSPMSFEIMSFVTPYGIGLDFGLEGLTWTFDVTDFAPILKGEKRLFMSRGGQWQEEMDIRFEFIEGIPDRDIIDIQQIWKVDQIAYGSIQNDWRFEPRQFTYDPNVSSYVIKTAISGHGQQGEFIPRQHVIDVEGFTDSWTVWKECAENPVYPQGGTWVYDRAGWCPGMATDIREYDVTPYFQFANTPTVDYNVLTASGDSRYIVNSQLVTYGEANKTNDVSVFDVIYPNGKIEHGRYNPSCKAPQIIIKNHGSESLKSVTIKYGIKGKSESSYNWQGNIPFLIEQKIVLPYDPKLNLAENGDIFFVNVETNDGTDQNLSNNSYETVIQKTDHYLNHLIIEWRTNLTPQETSYRVEDQNGNSILYKSGSVLNNNTIYRDTLSALNGCFTLRIIDTDNDGISWWANNDGNGYIRVKEEGGDWKLIATDFGAFIEYDFTAGMLTSVNNLEEVKNVFVYPNPSVREVYLSDISNWDATIKMSIVDELGRVIFSEESDNYSLSNRVLTGLENLHSGIYFIRLNDSRRQTVIKFSKL